MKWCAADSVDRTVAAATAISAGILMLPPLTIRAQWRRIDHTFYSTRSNPERHQ